ncbi:MAG: hypothetical protein L0219_06530, partial [Phycisphaerales bacterium]|nr:hypothetical protein [Phycisphaerales bacterium]
MERPSGIAGRSPVWEQEAAIRASSSASPTGPALRLPDRHGEYSIWGNFLACDDRAHQRSEHGGCVGLPRQHQTLTAPPKPIRSLGTSPVQAAGTVEGSLREVSPAHGHGGTPQARRATCRS